MSKKRILVFDGQVFQTPAWHRGMGKYSLELIAAVNMLNSANKHWSEIVVVLSNRLPAEKSVIRSLNQRAPGVRISQLSIAPNEYDNRPVAERNRGVIDRFLGQKLQGKGINGVDYVILSLMQSEIAPTFSSLNEVHNYLLFYDIIPLMFHKTYLPDAVNQKGYLSKLAELLRADTYLAISKTVANDLAGVLGINSTRIVSIDGAPIAHGHTPQAMDVPKPFILMPTGNDLRKNNRRGIEAFTEFNKKNKNKYHLLVTSTFQDFEVKEYKQITDKVIFTGNISGEELEYLYQETSALLFPTEYEGLGMPILEALEKNKPVACSDISVFQEMSSSAFFYFDPTEVNDIARGLSQAVAATKLPQKEYSRVLKKFTWERTAQLFFEQASKSLRPEPVLGKPRLAVICASVDEIEQSANIQQVYSELSRLSEVSYYMDVSGNKNKEKINYLCQIATTANIGDFQPGYGEESSRPIYYIEDSPNSAAVLITALANPGVLVLMDTSLERLWRGAVQRRLIHPSRFTAEQQINRMLKSKGMIASLVASQAAIITFSKELESQLNLLVKRLPDRTGPKVNYIEKPGAQFVYSELKQNLALYDYPGNEKNPGTGDYTEFASFLVLRSQEKGRNDE